MKRSWALPELVPAVLFVVVFSGAAIWNRYFLDFGYLLDTTSIYAESALLAIGVTFVIVAGGIDLSVASILALVACVTAKLMASGMSPWLAGGLGIALGTALGLVNGALVAYAKLPSFLVTLGTMALFRGAAQALMGSASVRLPDGFAGVDRMVVAGYKAQAPLVIVLVAFVVAAFALHRTIFGRHCFAVGTNERASFFAGVDTPRVKLATFAISGLMASVGALMMDSRLGVARYDHARGMELDAIAAAVLGGVAITGGRGTIGGVAIAIALLMVVRTAMGLANISPDLQLMAIGCVMIFSVASTMGLARASARRRPSR